MLNRIWSFCSTNIRWVCIVLSYHCHRALVSLYPYILYINSTIVSTCLTHDIVMLRNGPNVATGDCVCWDRGFDYNGADLPIGEIFNWSRDLAKEKQDFPKKAFSTQNFNFPPCCSATHSPAGILQLAGLSAAAVYRPRAQISGFAFSEAFHVVTVGVMSGLFLKLRKLWCRSKPEPCWKCSGVSEKLPGHKWLHTLDFQEEREGKKRFAWCWWWPRNW